MAFVETTVLAKKFWDVYIYCAGTSSWTGATWGNKAGQLDGDASLKASAGETLRLATGVDAMISENGEITFTIIGHNATPAEYAANYTALKELINKTANIMFVPAGTSPSATENIKISSMYVFPELQIQANQMNKIVVTAKREAGPGTAVTMNQANNT